MNDEELKALKKLVNTELGVRRLAAFVVLMQHGDGIMSKAPTYMLEKFFRYMQEPYEFMTQGMDTPSKELYLRWLARWKLD